MTFFVACQQAEVENQEAEDLRMSISASINGQKESPNSRYEGANPSEVAFSTGDAIGLFVDGKSAVKWTFESLEWTTDGIVYWPDKTKSHTFRAFYPYTEAATYTGVPMPSLLNQKGTIESISACDFLVATKVQSYTDGSMVKFTGEDHSFNHVSTLLKLVFKQGEELNGAILTKVTIEGSNIVSPSSYSFEEGEVTLVPDASSDILTADGLSYDMSSEQALYFIVNEKQDAATSVKLSVEYQVDGKNYVAQMNNFANSVFAGGLCQSYVITVLNSSLVISGADISAWGVGESLDDVEINGEEKNVSA